MSETKHTPGPAEIEIYAKNLHFYASLFRQNGWDTPTLSSGVFSSTLDEYAEFLHSRSQLIAAAPDLLAALKWALANGMLSYNARLKRQNEAFCNGVDRIHAAIAKATEER